MFHQGIQLDNYIERWFQQLHMLHCFDMGWDYIDQLYK